MHSLVNLNVWKTARMPQKIVAAKPMLTVGDMEVIAHLTHVNKHASNLKADQDQQPQPTLYTLKSRRKDTSSL